VLTHICTLTQCIAISHVNLYLRWLKCIPDSLWHRETHYNISAELTHQFADFVQALKSVLHCISVAEYQQVVVMMLEHCRPHTSTNTSHYSICPEATFIVTPAINAGSVAEPTLQTTFFHTRKQWFLL